MNTLYILALIIVAIGLILLLVQTARAAYWRGGFNASTTVISTLSEEIRDTRLQRDAARREIIELREYLQRLHERALLATSEPELFNELREANDVLRSLSAIVERDGADTNWAAIGERLEQRLERQHAMLYAAPVKA